MKGRITPGDIGLITYSNGEQKVKALTLIDLGLIHNYKTAKFQGVPLTPAILNACGFEEYPDAQHTGEVSFINNDNIAVSIFTGKAHLDSVCDEFHEGFEIDHSGFEVDIRYIHHLQALYEALTGLPLITPENQAAVMAAINTEI